MEHKINLTQKDKDGMSDKFLIASKTDTQKQNDLFNEMNCFLNKVIYKTIASYPSSKPYKDELYSYGLEIMGLALKNYKIGHNCFLHYYHKCCKCGIRHEAEKLTGVARRTVYITENNPDGKEVRLGAIDQKIQGNIDLKDTRHRIAEFADTMLDKEERAVILSQLRGQTINETAKDLHKKRSHVYYVYDKAKKRMHKMKDDKKLK